VESLLPNKEKKMLLVRSVFCAFLLLLTTSAVAQDLLQSLGKSARDTKQSATVVKQLLSRKDLSVTDVLTAMKSQDEVARNYYLSVAQAVADRNPQRAVEQCKRFIEQLDQDPTGRYWAFTYVTAYEPTSREKLLESMADDPSQDLRFEAVELKMKRLESLATQSAEEKQTEYSKLLQAARLPEQVQAIAKKLDESGKKVDLLKHFGFMSQWQAVGPFDNTNQAGFNVEYAPEKEYLAGKLYSSKLNGLNYDGKEKGLAWKSVETNEADGKIDLNAAYANAKGAIVYAVGNFQAAKGGPAEIRIGSHNAVKVWINGKPVIEREVYHAGGQIDQYIAPIELKAGSNSILLKICQNEQTEQWAQSWYFQIRISDSSGLAIQPALAAK
jgi:hypothetical protein